MDKTRKDDKMTPAEAELLLKMLLLNNSVKLKKIQDIEASDKSPEEKFQLLSEILNPVGGSK